MQAIGLYLFSDGDQSNQTQTTDDLKAIIRSVPKQDIPKQYIKTLSMPLKTKTNRSTEHKQQYDANPTPQVKHLHRPRRA